MRNDRPLNSFARMIGVGLLLASAIGIFAEPVNAQIPVASAVDLSDRFTDQLPGAVDFSSLPTLPTPNGADAASNSQASESQLRIVFLGNTLIHRASEYAFLETELKRRLPNKDVLFRNLGWPGDTVTGAARVEFGPGEENRSNWQRPDADVEDYGFLKMLHQLGRERPHILFIAYGSNVAFEGEAGLASFEAGLKRLLDALEPTGAHIVLLSPPPRDTSAAVIGHLAAQNQLLSAVASHLAEVARDRKCTYVDLFNEWPSPSEVPFTDNGIHLNSRGYQLLAAITAEALPLPSDRWQLEVRANGAIALSTGNTAQSAERTEYGLRWTVHDTHLPGVVERGETGAQKLSSGRRLRIAGLASGTHTLDIDGRRVARADAREWAEGVVIRRGPDFEQLEDLRQAILKKNQHYFYGFRPQNKAYTHLFRRHERGQHAAEIDRFALLVGETEQEIARLAVPVARTYELVRETDYPDHEVPGEAGEPNIEDELASFNIPEGFEISLYASDPMISKPININWDEEGRMWVATSAIYPHLQPGQTPNDKIILLEDVDQDGQADKSTVFAEGLLVPQSVIPGHGGVFVAQSTDLLFLRDTDGDGKADERQVLFTGFGNADVHHMIHGLRWGPGGDLYFVQSIYINTVVETPWGIRTANGSCVWRLRPELLRLEQYSQGLVNPWGYAFDQWGQSFATDGAGGSGIAYVFPGSAHATNGYAGRQLASMNQGRPKECGLEILSGRHLPEDWQQTLLSNDFRANRVTRYRLTDSGSGYTASFLGDMVTSAHRGFRPVDVKMGPDGAIYIVDWYNLIIDHGEVDFHHPLRDKMHGRIWRLAAKDSAKVETPTLAGAAVRDLLDALRLPEQWTRDQARRLLREREPQAVTAELRTWLIDNADQLTDRDRLEALWVFQGLRQAEPKLLVQVLTATDSRVRAAAVRVLSDWRDLVPDAMHLLSTTIADEHPRVRLEAVNALRRVGSRAAVELAMQVVDKPLDANLDFAAFRTAHELRDQWLDDFQAGERMFDGQPHRIAFALSAVGGAASLEPLVRLVKQAQLDPHQLVSALTVLASSGGSKESAVVFDYLHSLRPDAQNQILEAFLQSDRNKRPAKTDSLQRLLTRDDQRVRTNAVRLAGRWRIAAAWPVLLERAADANATVGERLAAAQALVEVDQRRGLEELQKVERDAPKISTQATAIAAIARASVELAAPRAANLLSTINDPELASVVVDALLNQQGGPQAFAAALSDAQLTKEVAGTVLQRIRLSGAEQSVLEAAIRRAGGLGALAKDLAPDEVADILRDVAIHGNARRGQEIFRRQRLQCLSCHAVDGQGGRVGPDLSSLGGSARLGDILRSLIAPSASIKEGYQTTQLITVDGQVIVGILQQQTESLIRVRDAKDQLQTIARDDIEEVVPSTVSIMPTGLTEMLTRDELVDLVRYLLGLGRQVTRER